VKTVTTAAMAGKKIPRAESGRRPTMFLSSFEIGGSHPLFGSQAFLYVGQHRYEWFRFHGLNREGKLATYRIDHRRKRIFYDGYPRASDAHEIACKIARYRRVRRVPRLELFKMDFESRGISAKLLYNIAARFFDEETGFHIIETERDLGGDGIVIQPRKKRAFISNLNTDGSTLAKRAMALARVLTSAAATG